MTLVYKEIVNKTVIKTDVKSDVRPVRDDLVVVNDEVWKVVQCAIVYEKVLNSSQITVFCKKITDNDVCHL